MTWNYPFLCHQLGSQYLINKWLMYPEAIKTIPVLPCTLGKRSAWCNSVHPWCCLLSVAEYSLESFSHSGFVAAKLQWPTKTIFFSSIYYFAWQVTIGEKSSILFSDKQSINNGQEDSRQTKARYFLCHRKMTMLSPDLTSPPNPNHWPHNLQGHPYETCLESNK